MERLNVKPTEYRLVHPSYLEVPSYLSACDFGIFFLSQSKIALSIKVVEYMAVGLPVLVNNNCMGALDMLLKEEAGAEFPLGVGDLDIQDQNLSEDYFKQMKTRFCKEKIAETAQREYSNTVVSAKYANLYKRLSAGSTIT